MEHFTGCMICGEELVYSQDMQEVSCSLCNKSAKSNAMCQKGHYVCDACHGLSAVDYIEAFCVASKEENPFVLANTLMKDKRIKMHGPEHHFLVPAVLLTAYYNATAQESVKHDKLDKAKTRAANVLGGFCGFYGSCGAGVGTGIFMSLLNNTTPLSTDSWRLANLMTAGSLTAIAETGGPRCCKRDTYLSLETAVKFVEEHQQVSLPVGARMVCGFSKSNTECLKANCPFFNVE